MTVRSPLRVLLGVSGGIAAFKAPEIVRRARACGFDVRCALTAAAKQFVSPLTLEVLSGVNVYQEEYLSPGSGGEELHVSAAQWADVLCIAPATAHILARLSLGLADDFLTTTALVFDGKVALAPAMHHVMWRRETTAEHVERLRRRGVTILGPIEGALASGEIGMGRMVEPEQIVAWLGSVAENGASLAGRTVLVSAGPTHEPLDPVRYLGNRSSGKMGFALAAEAARRGARVVLVAGPVSLPTPPQVERRDVVTAREMQAAVYDVAPQADLIVLAAAVADFRPAKEAGGKIKKKDGAKPPRLELVTNPDILAGLADLAPTAIRVGFAAETEELLAHAREKLKRKRVQFMVANDVSRVDIGFASEHNEVVVLREAGEPVSLERKRKEALAAELMDLFGAALPAPESRGPRT